MANTSILISGAGIAGPALAYWLREQGLTPTVVERAPAPRPGGQTVDLRGAGRTVVDRMGLLQRVRDVSVSERGIAMVNASGRVLARMPADLFGGEGIVSEIEVLRDDLCRVLYEATLPETEYLFDDTVTALQQDGNGVTVGFERSGTRRFDLVVGADGPHSAVRGLAFGPESRFIVLTSGTTGTPKGARRPTPKGLSDAAIVYSRIPLRVGDRIHVATPLFHTWGFAALQLAMPLRAMLTLRRRFDPVDALRTIARSRCTAMFVVPVMLQRIMELPERVRARYDTSTLRIVASSGSALPGRLVEDFTEAFGDVLYNFYGSTEVSWASIADPADLRAAPSTAGRSPLGTRLEIRDGRGRPVPPGTTGEIAVGNDMLFEGYTDRTSRPMSLGLMSTGDRGYLDANGRLFVVGRADDMIISGGENVYPQPVEDILAAMPEVREAAVVGVPDLEYGQRLAAYIVTYNGGALDAGAVRDHIHQRLPRYYVPRDVVFLDELPRNATGKVLKRLLAD